MTAKHTEGKLEADNLVRVCSARPRASTGSRRGHQWWKREVYHIAKASAVRTVCGVDRRDWLVIGPMTGSVTSECCRKCGAILTRIKEGS